MLKVTKQPKIEINEVCELSQDSFYTRNPEDANIPGAIGPNSPESIFVKSVEIVKYEELQTEMFGTMLKLNMMVSGKFTQIQQ